MRLYTLHPWSKLGTSSVGLQEVATKLGVLGEDVVSPVQLVEACLNSGSRELALCAFQVFTSAGSKFCSGNHSLLEEAWLRAVDQDDWLAMKRTADEEGWTDDHIMQVIQDSLLYQASRHCYGDSQSSRFARDVSPESVEKVIAKHPSYPEAGQAMLTAFRLGFYLGSDLPEGSQEGDGEQMIEM
jgi:nuclear pore complex protein Nup133